MYETSLFCISYLTQSDFSFLNGIKYRWKGVQPLQWKEWNS